jgi:hypothetical protein
VCISRECDKAKACDISKNEEAIGRNEGTEKAMIHVEGKCNGKRVRKMQRWMENQGIESLEHRWLDEESTRTAVRA